MSNRLQLGAKVPVNDPNALETAFASVREAIGNMKFGHIQLTVHDGRLVQLDVTERQRFG